ncbi:LmeA family phospholipid-binding protein [Corynebacterium vitaeruminis]|uniref:Uncharacterized protein n=1 Tax=Corynebacterium vitaeruminis DSM 20294 TaxID=1224164 RepID=W5Y5G6_9CORY|nr:DUF2993 domain-containing protein [Corynebacterium vitaeruminis]AHI21748.1 hypothetical protein B843_01780 [Corynebacterium vitaeruminis DSM 20294]
MRTSKLGKTLLGIIVGVIVLLLVAEFGLRWYIGKQLGDQMQASSTGEKASVSFGASPLILGMATGKIPEVTVDSPSTVTITAGTAGEAPTITGQPESHVTMKDLDFAANDNATAGSVDMVTTMTDEYLLAVVQRQMADNNSGATGTTLNGATGDQLDLGALAGQLIQQLVTVTGITSDPANGTVDVQITNGAAALTLRPQAQDGKLTFTAENASIFGVSLPTEVSDALTQGFSQKLQEIGPGLSLADVTVVDGGVKIHVVGTNVPLSSLEDAEQAANS